MVSPPIIVRADKARLGWTNSGQLVRNSGIRPDPKIHDNNWRFVDRKFRSKTGQFVNPSVLLNLRAMEWSHIDFTPLESQETGKNYEERKYLLGLSQVSSLIEFKMLYVFLLKRFSIKPTNGVTFLFKAWRNCMLWITSWNVLKAAVFLSTYSKEMDATVLTESISLKGELRCKTAGIIWPLF